MKVSKRQFLKLGLGGTAACVLAPLFQPASLTASPLVMPGRYLHSAVHGYWMRLSYNGRAESRKVRRTIGAALRNIGAIKGTGGGYDFALSFDRAVEAVFLRWVATRQKPETLFGLIQRLYDDFIEPELGPDGGRALFGTLLGMLRGYDGSSNGAETYQAYLTYRSRALAYKDAARTAEDPTLVEKWRQARKAALESWRTLFLAQVDGYATQQTRLNLQFTVGSDMIRGFPIYVRPDPGRSRLRIDRRANGVAVDFNGSRQLQGAPTPAGPWTPTRKAPPAGFDAQSPRRFFRTTSVDVQ